MKYKNIFYVKRGQESFPLDFLKKAYNAVRIYNETVEGLGSPSERVTLDDQGAHLILDRSNGDDKDTFVISLDYPIGDDGNQIVEYFETDSEVFDTIVKAILTLAKENGVLEDWKFEGEDGDEHRKAGDMLADAVSRQVATGTDGDEEEAVVRAVLIDPYDEKVEVVEIDTSDNLDERVKYLLRCEQTEFGPLRIGNEAFDIMVNTGKENDRWSAFDTNMRPVLAGELLVFGHCPGNHVTGLSDSGIEYVMNNIKYVTADSIEEEYDLADDKSGGYPALVNLSAY